MTTATETTCGKTIEHDATTYRGVRLDRMVETGPRGGTTTYWRAACKRTYQVASWSRTRDDAARSAPGYQA